MEQTKAAIRSRSARFRRTTLGRTARTGFGPHPRPMRKYASSMLHRKRSAAAALEAVAVLDCAGTTALFLRGSKFASPERSGITRISNRAAKGRRAAAVQVLI